MDFSSSDPLFPEFKPLFSRCRRSLDSFREVSLCQLDALFARFLPVELLSQADEGPNSRDRSYTLRRTFWAGILQALTPHTSLRCVALQFAALFGLLGKKELSSASGAYCTARKRLPLARLERALEASAAAAQQRAGTHGYLAGRPVKVVDATSVQLPDTRANQARFPQPRSQKPGCGFPVMKLGALFCLTSGALLGVVFQGLDWHDVRLFRSLWQWLKRGDIVLGDRAFGDYVSFVQLAARGVDLLTRLHQARKPDFRRAVRKLGRDDGIFRWNKPLVRPKYLTRRAFARLPAELLVRIIRFRVQEPGFRSRTIYLATGLLDDKSYPASSPSDFDRAKNRFVTSATPARRTNSRTEGLKSRAHHAPESSPPARSEANRRKARPRRAFQPTTAIFAAIPSVASRLKFQARHTSVHSSDTFSRPLIEKRRKPSTSLMMPNTGSTVCLRNR